MFKGLSPADSVITPLRLIIMVVLILLLTYVIFRKQIHQRRKLRNAIIVREDPRARRRTARRK